MTFRKLDFSERGWLSPEQLDHALKRFFAMTNLDAKQSANVFAALDKNKDGKVDKQEFINGFLDGRNSAKERAEEAEAKEEASYPTKKFIKYAAANGCGHRYHAQVHGYPPKSWAYSAVRPTVADTIAHYTPPPSDKSEYQY